MVMSVSKQCMTKTLTAWAPVLALSCTNPGLAQRASEYAVIGRPFSVPSWQLTHELLWSNPLYGGMVAFTVGEALAFVISQGQGRVVGQSLDASTDLEITPPPFFAPMTTSTCHKQAGCVAHEKEWLADYADDHPLAVNWTRLYECGAAAP